MCKKFIVITSINKPTKAIAEFAKWKGWQVVVVGDKKTPKDWHLRNVKFFSLEEQYLYYPRFAKIIPENSYKRKMLGYIYAIQHGAEMIFETDDDNYPYKNAWLNVYEKFGAKRCWPRGFPVGVAQFLVDRDPDVDAIYRMTENKEVIFEKRKPILLNGGQYCPFNSQATLWPRELFSMMYFPIDVTDRTTDILRSYIAMSCLWKLDRTVSFNSPIMYQKRNIHNLLEDFLGEMDLYMHSEEWVKRLSRVRGKNAEELYISALKLLKMNTRAYGEFIKLI